MNKVWSSAVVVAGLVLTLGGAASWGQVPSTNDTSDNFGNTGSGTDALKNITPDARSGLGSNNTAFGDGALKSDTAGTSNTAVGFNTLMTNSESHWNTAVGFEALKSTTNGVNTAVGGWALTNNNDGIENTATGFAALYGNTTGSYNTAFGGQALGANTTGNGNTATGTVALGNNTAGISNSAVGQEALYLNATGSQNTASGFKTLRENIAGKANTAVGYQALLKSTGSRNLALGLYAGFKLTSGDRNIYLGHTGAANESNTMRLGQAQGQTRTFIAGIYGVPVSGSTVLINGQGQLGTQVSSARYKRDIQAMGERSQGLHQLRPVTFRYKQDAQGQRQYGLIAEEVVKVYPELVTKGADGKVESVQYHELIPMLLNEVQYQQQRLSAQSQELAELKAQNEEQRAQNAALAARLERLEEGAVRAATLASH